MKVAITGDVHGSLTWKALAQRLKDKELDKCVLLGDYVDSYGDKTREEEIANLKEIIDWKKSNMDKVVLLLGNHDINQYLLNEPCSRKASQPYFSQIKELLEDNLDLFDIAVEVKDGNNVYVVSHAGFTKTWMKDNEVETIEDANTLLHNGEYEAFEFDGIDCYGANITQGPTWVRPEALVKDWAFAKQIVGHTQSRKSPLIINENGLELHILENPKHDCVVICEGE